MSRFGDPFLGGADWNQWVQRGLLEYGLPALGFLLAVILVLTIWLWVVRTRAARRVRRHAAWGEDAERRAGKLLRKKGYRIAAVQEHASYHLRVDGVSTLIHVRADFLVEKAGRTYVAEVKAGEESAKLTRTTRRQLLEYWIAFDVDGVLLVDMHGAAVRLVEFPRSAN